MKKELDALLTKKYPLLYADRYGDGRNTGLNFGFQNGDGWFKILDDLGAELEPLIQKHIDEYGVDPDYGHPRASQVKEKFAGLRHYMTTSTNEMDWLINIAENRSYYTCETCGSEKGKVRGWGWISTICNKCNLKKVAYNLSGMTDKKLIYEALLREFYPKTYKKLWRKQNKDHPAAQRKEPTRKEKLLSFLRYKIWWNVKAPFQKYFWKYGPDRWKTKMLHTIWKIKRKLQGKRLK